MKRGTLLAGACIALALVAAVTRKSRRAADAPPLDDATSPDETHLRPPQAWSPSLVATRITSWQPGIFAGRGNRADSNRGGGSRAALAGWFSPGRRAEAPRADALSRRKQDFLGLLSHELRNPLSAIHAALAVMRARESTEAGQHARRVIERQVAHIARLVEDLVDTARIERGTLSLQVDSVDVRDVLAVAVEMAQPSLESRRQHFAWERPSEPMIVSADRVRLQQVFSNLLLNASKYTPEGGRIELRAYREASDICIDVRDNGQGLRPEELTQVFEPFVRASRDQSGLGIGLYVARTIIEQHGGEIGVTSDGAQSGATFTVRLPELSPLLQRL